MDTSLRSLEEALSIRRQIDTLEKRLASLLGTGLSRSAVSWSAWMTCKECGQVVKLTRTMNKCHSNTELSSLEETRCQFNGGTGAIKLGIDVHQDFYVVVEQAGGSNPKPPQRFPKAAFLHWAAKLKSQATEVYAVYEACGFGFSLQRKLSALSIKCYVVCPQKLDEQNRRVKTDGLDAKALCLKLDRFVQGNRDALAGVRVPT